MIILIVIENLKLYQMGRIATLVAQDIKKSADASLKKTLGVMMLFKRNLSLISSSTSFFFVYFG